MGHELMTHGVCVRVGCERIMCADVCMCVAVMLKCARCYEGPGSTHGLLLRGCKGVTAWCLEGVVDGGGSSMRNSSSSVFFNR